MGQKPVRVKKPHGRPAKMPLLRDLVVGSEILIYWPAGEPYTRDNNLAIKNIHQAIRREAREKNKKFIKFPSVKGLLVRRVA